MKKKISGKLFAAIEAKDLKVGDIVAFPSPTRTKTHVLKQSAWLVRNGLRVVDRSHYSHRSDPKYINGRRDFESNTSMFTRSSDHKIPTMVYYVSQEMDEQAPTRVATAMDVLAITSGKKIAPPVRRHLHLEPIDLGFLRYAVTAKLDSERDPATLSTLRVTAKLVGEERLLKAMKLTGVATDTWDHDVQTTMRGTVVTNYEQIQSDMSGTFRRHVDDPSDFRGTSPVDFVHYARHSDWAREEGFWLPMDTILAMEKAKKEVNFYALGEKTMDTIAQTLVDAWMNTHIRQLVALERHLNALKVHIAEKSQQAREMLGRYVRARRNLKPLSDVDELANMNRDGVPLSPAKKETT